MEKTKYKFAKIAMDHFLEWLDDLPPPREGDDPRCIVRSYIIGYLHDLEES